MIRKIFFLLFAFAAIAVAFFSYSKFYARKDIKVIVDNARLSASVKTALALNRQLKTAEIDVSVTEGEILLDGSVGTTIQRQLAEEITRSIRGVNEVHNNLLVNKLIAAKPVDNERTLGEKLDDLTIEASVKTALLLNENVRARDIKVSSLRGHVVLAGSVDSVAEYELARKIADDVEGVVAVQNDIQLSGKENGAVPPKVDDKTLVTQVRAALMVNRNIDSTEIEIGSHNGIVTLTGLVHSGAEKDLVQKIAEGCWGVGGVVNEIRVRQAPNEQ